MPSVTIDLLEGRAREQIDSIADAVQEAMVEHLDVVLRSRPGQLRGDPPRAVALISLRTPSPAGSRHPDHKYCEKRLASGATEIVCVVQARTPEQRDALLLKGLPGSRHVVGVSAHLLLETYSPEAWPGLAVALTPDEVSPVAFAAATTGPTNLIASVICRSTRHLFEYLNTRLQSLPAIHAVETAPVIRTLKRTGSLPAH